MSTESHHDFIVKLYPTMKKSSEATKMIGKRPNVLEIIVGYLSLITLMVQMMYKFYTHRGRVMTNYVIAIFVFNPCHIVVLSQSFMLLLPKS